MYKIREIIYLVNVKHVVTKLLLKVLNAPPATLEVKPRVNQKKPRFPSRIRFYHFWRTLLSQPLLDQSDQSARFYFTPIATPFRYL
jgi:hypothetical protein